MVLIVGLSPADADLEDDEIEEEEVTPPGAEYSNYNPFVDASRMTEFGKPQILFVFT